MADKFKTQIIAGHKDGDDNSDKSENYKSDNTNYRISYSLTLFVL